MGLPILIYGKSGSGKTASLRNVKGKWLVVNVNKKPLPFKKIDTLVSFSCNDYQIIKQQLKKGQEVGYKSIVIDDAGYLMTNKFMIGHRGKTGNAQFELFNEIADNFYTLITYIVDELSPDTFVYIIMHENTNDFGEVKPKTIGKLLDEKVNIEGMFTIALRATKDNGKYLFTTQSNGLDCSKSPIGMFESETIDNDIQIVDEKIRRYYN